LTDLAAAQTVTTPSPPISTSEITRKGDAAYKRKDYATALIFYTQAINAGDMTAQAALGRLYLYGLGVPQDVDRGMNLVTESAKANNVLAWKILGETQLYQSKPTEKQYATAMTAFRRAADQGDAEAERKVGVMYQAGLGVPAPDAAEAAKWLRKAADQNDADAQLLLGDLYDDGEGVARDHEEALRWWRKAADNGDKKAKQRLADIKNAEIANVPPALQMKCYFLSKAINDVPNNSKNPIVQSFAHLNENPKYRACIEENLKEIRELMK
jgi:TPR repeat protein